MKNIIVILISIFAFLQIDAQQSFTPGSISIDLSGKTDSMFNALQRIFTDVFLAEESAVIADAVNVGTRVQQTTGEEYIIRNVIAKNFPVYTQAYTTKPYSSGTHGILVYYRQGKEYLLFFIPTQQQPPIN